MYTEYMHNDSLAHHGIKGMKWGIRRYQNSDGSLTEEGKRRYLNSDGSLKRVEKGPINWENYYINKRLSNVEKKTDKKYNLTRQQKKYMDESGNLTLRGGKSTIGLGYDLGKSKYKKKAAKELKDYNDSWEKYFKDRSQESYDLFKENQDKLFKKIDEIDVQEGRDWVLKQVTPKQKAKLDYKASKKKWRDANKEFNNTVKSFEPWDSRNESLESWSKRTGAEELFDNTVVPARKEYQKASKKYKSFKQR